jgi:hypothetical protein
VCCPKEDAISAAATVAVAVDAFFAGVVNGGTTSARPLGRVVEDDKVETVGTAEDDLFEMWPGLFGLALDLDDEDTERCARGGRTFSTFAVGPRRVLFGQAAVG